MPSTVASIASAGGKSSTNNNNNFKMDLMDLLDRSQQLLPVVDNFIQKDLESIHEQSKKLIQKTARGDVQSKGDYLLAAHGFDVEKYRRTVSRLDLKQAFEPLEPIGETDIEGYLKHEHDMILLSSVEESKRHTSSCFYKNFNDHLEDDWKSAKESLMKTLNLHKAYQSQQFRPSLGLNDSVRKPSKYSSFIVSSGNSTPFSSPINQNTTLMAPTPKRGKTTMDERMIAYSTVVYNINKTMKADQTTRIIDQFSEAAKYIEESVARKREVTECWRLLSFMINENNVHGEISQKDLLRGAKEYMETSYVQYIKDLLGIEGEVPDKLKLIEQFVAETTKNILPEHLGESINGNYIWPVLFYCLRCGFIEEALRFTNDHIAYFSQVIISALENKKEAQTSSSSSLEQQLHELYRKIPPNRLFQHAVYLVLGRCDVKKTIPQIFSKTEDFMWLKLSIIRDDSNYTLQDLQKIVTSHGPKHFCPKKNSLLYFKLLLCTLQFERAIQYLCSRQSEGYHVEAVHFAFTLYFYDLLNVSEDTSAPLLTEKDGCQLNFHFLIKDYIRIFAHTDPCIAASYFYIFYKRDEKKKYFKSIKELIIEGKDVSVLLGHVDIDGKLKNGFLHYFLDSFDFLELAESCAQLYNEAGRYRDSVDIYSMALLYNFSLMPDLSVDTPNRLKKYIHSILAIMIDELSQVLTGGENREEVKQLASKVFKNFTDNKILQIIEQSNKKNFETFKMLLSLTKVFDSFLNRNYDRTLADLQQLQIVPFKKQELESISLRQLDKKIQKKLPDILFVAMCTLCHLHSSSRSHSQNEIKDMASNVMSFAGLNEELVSSDVTTQLLQFVNRMK
ncbi:nucleoporin nup93 [Naegleria gruberi]|uniref:Nuclear pore protein n=1 Tax=Naegleria gruberi TaxID=5762 RepID=D2V3I5_NAEGR|nr:nucleoporin nup93 [Naegleria gruberi]EFC48642.1 nucleoporin nup93 [Naegleria gruberi]|eukprot:XP_002681386.1 nucleoporin nup93 [Naegleria gruberi strain NEG-M]